MQLIVHIGRIGEGERRRKACQEQKMGRGGFHLVRACKGATFLGKRRCPGLEPSSWYRYLVQLGTYYLPEVHVLLYVYLLSFCMYT